MISNINNINTAIYIYFTFKKIELCKFYEKKRKLCNLSAISIPVLNVIAIVEENLAVYTHTQHIFVVYVFISK